MEWHSRNSADTVSNNMMANTFAWSASREMKNVRDPAKDWEGKDYPLTLTGTAVCKKMNARLNPLPAILSLLFIYYQT